MNIYLASSWRNPYQPAAVEALRQAGHDVYDFRHPPGGDHLGFSWADVDPEWKSWGVGEYLTALGHPIAKSGFESDFAAMEWAHAGVLLLPAGRSAHLEAGYFVGARKPLVIVLDEAEFEQGAAHSVIELMYRSASAIVTDLGETIAALTALEESAA